jgi:hypothetical protein
MKHLFSLTIALLGASLVCRADETATPTTLPPPVTETYAVHDGTTLQWDIYTPANFAGTYPVVLVLHVGGFKGGERSDVAKECQTLAASGLVACAIDYRLDQLNRFLNQTEPAYAAGIGAAQVQVDDVESAIVVASNPPSSSYLFGHVTGWVGGLGGSSGAGHVMYCSVVSDLVAHPFDAGALLSGPYEFDDEASLFPPPPQGNCKAGTFLSNMAEFCEVNQHKVQKGKKLPPNLAAGSPIYQIVTGATVSPMLILGTVEDPIGPTQRIDLINRLSGNGFNNYSTNELSGCLHAYEYWNQSYINGQKHGEPVSQYVTDWLKGQVFQP